MTEPILSQDHRWRWDGQRWVPVAEAPHGRTKRRWRRAWTRILITGLILWVLAVIVDLDEAPDGDLGPVVPPPSASAARPNAVTLPQSR